jgi:hypothetical protein
MTAASLSFLLAGCGGGSDAYVPPAAATPPIVIPPAEVIVGVATPVSVAVVTATNAQ